MVTLDEFIDKLNKIREENKGNTVYVYANDCLGYVNPMESLDKEVYVYGDVDDPDNVMRLVIEVL